MRHQTRHPSPRRTGLPAPAPKAGRCGGRGFTLIELLTVVAIIGLLVGMIVPTLRSIYVALHKAATRVRIQNLDAGANQYRMLVTGNKYFPGQDYVNLSFPTKFPLKDMGTLKANPGKPIKGGSDLLAWCLFTDPNGLFPTSAYGKYEEDMLDDPAGTYSGVPFTVLDTYPDKMPILYYVARKGVAGASQYVKDDNKVYLTADNHKIDANSWTSFVGGTIPYNSGQFLLIAPGKNRKYMDEDDIKNWK